jgi:hypothetical protein
MTSYSKTQTCQQESRSPFSTDPESIKPTSADQENIKRIKRYQALREAYASMISEPLQTYPWQWWATFTSKEQISLTVLKKRFWWWLRCLRKAQGRWVEYIAFIERQRRGVLHVHAVIYGVRTDKPFWRAMVKTWEIQASGERRGELFGKTKISRFDPGQAGKLCLYLAKERCKDLLSGRTLEGNGHLAEVVWWSGGVQKRLAVLNRNRTAVEDPTDTNEVGVGGNTECNNRQINTCGKPVPSLKVGLVNSGTDTTSSGLIVEHLNL